MVEQRTLDDDKRNQNEGPRKKDARKSHDDKMGSSQCPVLVSFIYTSVTGLYHATVLMAHQLDVFDPRAQGLQGNAMI